MDHIPNLRKPIYPHMPVPYLSIAQYPYAYDNLGFKFFPNRHSWDSARFLKGDFTFNGVEDPDRTAAFIQGWLYFGFMAEFFGREVDIEADFVKTDECGRRVVTTERLGLYIDAWQDGVVEMKEEEKRIEVARLDHLLQDSYVYISACISQDTIALHDRPVPIPQELQLSLAILFATLGAAKIHVFPNSDSAYLSSHTCKSVIDRLKMDGWCGSDIALLFGGNVGGDSPSSILELYYASLLGPRKNRKDHLTCRESRCLGYQIDDESYQTRHLEGCIGCLFIEVPLAELCSIIDGGYTPLITLTSTSDSGSIQISLKPATPATPAIKSYVAISHVYADGLGNRQSCALPHCQLNSIRQRVDSLYTLDGHIGSRDLAIPFWMDTLCIPVQPSFKRQRNLAIARMAQIYEAADKVLVFSAELEYASREATPEEVFMRITSNSWFRRLWTLQEGVLARRLYFQFGDGPLDLEYFLAGERNLEGGRFSVTKRLRAQGIKPYGRLCKFRKVSGRDRIKELYHTAQWRSTSYPKDYPICFGTLLGLDISPIVNAQDDDERMKAFIIAQRQFPKQILYFLEPRMAKWGLGWQLINHGAYRTSPEIVGEESTLGWANEEGLHVVGRGFVLEAAGLAKGRESGAKEDKFKFEITVFDEEEGVGYDIRGGFWLADTNPPASWADVLARWGVDKLGIILEHWPLKLQAPYIDPGILDLLTKVNRDLMSVPSDILSLDNNFATAVTDYGDILENINTSYKLMAAVDRHRPSQTRGALVAIIKEAKQEIYTKFCGTVVVVRPASPITTDHPRTSGIVTGEEQRCSDRLAQPFSPFSITKGPKTIMADMISLAGGISSPSDMMSSLSSLGTLTATLARSLVEDYAENEPSSESTSRILNAFLDHLPPGGSAVVANDIVDGKDDLRQLAHHYLSSILIPVRAGGGRTPKAISARPGDDMDSVGDIASTITSQRHDQTRLKADCLARDGNRCLLTRAYDVNKADEILSDEERQNTVTLVTEAAHILPFSLAAFDEPDRQYKATVWNAIYRMFPDIRGFSLDDINDPRNAMTMYAGFHSEFGKLELCFEPTTTSNRYRIKAYRKFHSFYTPHLPNDGFVTFTAHDGRYLLPDPKLLSVHASVGAVLHASGMAEYIERILRDREELRCLAHNGSTQIGVLMMAV
ncbi:MAG: hypothetical protein M1839_008963 [Geoglossum umbratile]|nr:MAG: hypothetical protein M1839_008963 [Geoglossum umbratile]